MYKNIYIHRNPNVYQTTTMSHRNGYLFGFVQYEAIYLSAITCKWRLNAIHCDILVFSNVCFANIFLIVTSCSVPYTKTIEKLRSNSAVF